MRRINFEHGDCFPAFLFTGKPACHSKDTTVRGAQPPSPVAAAEQGRSDGHQILSVDLEFTSQVFLAAIKGARIEDFGVVWKTI